MSGRSCLGSFGGGLCAATSESCPLQGCCILEPHPASLSSKPDVHKLIKSGRHLQKDKGRQQEGRVECHCRLRDFWQVAMFSFPAVAASYVICAPDFATTCRLCRVVFLVHLRVYEDDDGSRRRKDRASGTVATSLHLRVCAETCGSNVVVCR